LPDLGELGRTSSTVDYQHHHHHHHHHHHRHVVGKHAADTRKMSIPDRSTLGVPSGRRDRRDAFAQQKSFSCEAACTGRRLPPTPGDLAAAARSRRGGGDPRAGGGTSAYPVDRRRRLLMESKKSYSLDDQIAASHIHGPADPSPPRDAGRPPVGRDAARFGGREPAVSGERSPSGAQHRKLLMLHTMRALQHDHYETTDTVSDHPPPPPPPPQRPPDIHATADSTATAAAAATMKAAALTSMVVRTVPPKIADPPPRVPPPTRRVDRLPIARIWSRLKFDRRTITASGKK